LSETIRIYTYAAHVDRVVDGDTIDLTISLGFDIYIKERVRLFGVDTPETRTRNKKEKEAGLKAKNYVKTLLENTDIRISTEEKGKFGRYLAIIYRELEDGTFLNVNKDIIDKKLAREYFGDKKKAWPE
jgi:endonuclease YncB( thermonuclease family)